MNGKKKIRVKKKEVSKEPAKVTFAQAKRAKKVSKEGSKATSHVTVNSEGEYTGKRNPAIERRVKIAEANLRKQAKRKGSAEYKKAESALKKAQRERALHNRSSSRAADIAKAQESGFTEGRYSEKLRKRQSSYKRRK